MSDLINRILFKKIYIYPLITFRVIFGFLMLLSTLRFLWLGWVEDHFINTQFQFKYYGFEWVPLLSPIGMYAVHAVILISSLGLMLGLYYRFSVISLFLAFTYTQLIDLTYYLNHYYFVSLILFLLCFMPASAFWSLDVKLGIQKQRVKVEAWCINILKFQIFVVYFFAGIAKLNPTWLLEALPLKIWLPAHNTLPFLGQFFAHHWSPYIFSWAGMFYDTFIVFFLLWPLTRFWAYGMVIVFHTLVGILFQIGVFPIVMIGVTLLFFSTRWHQQVIQLFNKNLKWAVEARCLGSTPLRVRYRGLKAFLLGLFIMFSLLFPLRSWAYNGNVFWTEQGYRFSWRVMLMEKAGTALFYVKDGATGREGVVDNSEFLNLHQEKQMSFQPDMILQFAHFLGEHYHAKGLKNPQVRVEAWVTLNGAASQLIIDPNVNLISLNDSWCRKNWIIPYEKGTK